MPATDYHQQQGPFSSFGRTLFSLRRDTPPHAAAMPPPPEAEEAAVADLEASFQRRVAGVLSDLREGSGDDGFQFLSAPWLRRLLEAFLLCQDDFRAVSSAAAQAQRCRGAQQAERLAAEFHERAVKLLDVCNAARDGVDQARRWARLAGIAASAAAGEKEIHEGQLRRARKALSDLSALLADASSSAASSIPHRNRSFGRNSAKSSPALASISSSSSSSSSSHFRSLSWGVSRSWSAARQLQAIGTNLTPPPRTHEGAAAAAYAMGCVLHLTAWALVAAVPCPDRAAALHHLPTPPPPRAAAAYPWAPPLLAITDRLAEEGKRKDSRRSNSCGFFLKEIHGLEKSSRRLSDAIDAGERMDAAAVREAAAELAAACAAVKDGLDPLERTVREVFRCVVRCRMEGLDLPLLAAG
ncbi:uncharacterized protein LOC100827001 [Brachypodium distachyon]|uniref:uncharacterized protein LOC100827001 n=1 Tax=Brachypodium distachyon TaxID=15368 RepID=UPI0001C710CB|nr:uncharacterized protein LOC100827001 [Brachypodium distachyon]XP_024310696.1 uncharacterized protein LOC100827001 [Brachypodium distachyon]|eukprot:XP_003576269.1 uncharacterized protein LOC100827001 [Brachypodium distachyon]